MKTKVKEIGPVCIYCGTLTEDMCCGEIHNEIGYETLEIPIYIVLESELTENYEIVKK